MLQSTLHHIATGGSTVSDNGSKPLARAASGCSNKAWAIGLASTIIASSAFFSTACSQSPDTAIDKPKNLDVVGESKNKINELKKSADSHFDKGEPEAAIEDLTALLQLTPKDADALYLRGRCYLDIEKPKEARVDFELGNQYEPNNRWYKNWSQTPNDLEYDLTHKAQTPAQEWAIACAAFLFASNGDGLHSLPGQAITEENRNIQAKTIYEWWGVRTREDLLAQLETLNNNRAYNSLWQSYMKVKKGEFKPEQIPDVAQDLKAGKFPERMYVVNQYGDELGDRGLNAWDLCRYINLVRRGYLLGFVSEKEAYDLIMPVAAKIQKQNSSWEQMNREYLIGRKFWDFSQWETREAKSNRVTKRLLTLKTSPWVYLPWNTKLDN